MKVSKMSKIEEIIETLNGINVGELDAIKKRLDSVRTDLKKLNFVDQAVAVQDASRMLSRGDLAGFRKLLATIVSQLGHNKGEES